MTKRYIRRRQADWQPADGLLLVHNQVSPPFGRHLDRLGDNGFRAWTQLPDDEPVVVSCQCDFAPQVAVHYQVAADAEAETGWMAEPRPD